MRTNAKCMITGCELIFEDTHEVFRGDLFSLGDCWVFNAVTNGSGEAWDTKEVHPSRRGSKALIANCSNPHFERRGVFTFPKDSAHLNEEAREYVDETPY